MPSARRRPAPARGDIDPRTRTAYHEAGHAVLSCAINDTPDHVSIRAAHGTLGRSAQRMFARPTSLAQVYLAGFAAEHLLTGRRPREFDIEVGLAVLSHSDPALVSAFDGIEASDGYGAVQEVLRTGVREVDEEIRQEVERLYEIARKSLAAVWTAVDVLAKLLLETEELDREGVRGALGEFDVLMPVLAVQRAHGLLQTPVSTSPSFVAR
jgi:hypothetical protein